ncbi:hypothetical protein NHX12_003918 [Muraenolepis orangiensis]|uniref:Uncharacterized protein n=1 Tax=Muraenolepis orangiensis TaxID=630683 RepID=A0A9Q0IF30_9TELE|nr:hypothetical protein NHX12_003918 [Muraenolepis orangiensis]
MLLFLRVKYVCVLTNRHVLMDLLWGNVTLVAPMLESRVLYSIFWYGRTPQVFLINLKRRYDQHQRMPSVLGVHITVTEAVDCKVLNSSQIQAIGIDKLSGYKDPYSDCVLTRVRSHYNIWKQVAIYLGRKRLQVKEPEVWVMGVSDLVHPDYSYWTLGYALSLQGTHKLLDSKPHGKMLPIDEFLPIMFKKHPK